MTEEFRGRNSRRHAQWLAGKAALAKEIADAQGGEDRFLALLGQDPELDPALLDVEDGIGRVPLGKDDLPPVQLGPGFSGADLGQKQLGIESRFFFDLHDPVPPANRSSVSKGTLQMAGSNVLDMAVVSPLFGCPIVWPSLEDRIAAADLGLTRNGVKFAYAYISSNTCSRSERV